VRDYSRPTITVQSAFFTLHLPEFQRPQAPPLPQTPPPQAQRELPLAEIALLQRPDLPPLPTAPPIPPPPRDIEAPELALPERDIPAPLPQLELRPLPTPALAPVEMAAQSIDIETREIALTPVEPPPPAPPPPDAVVTEIDLTPPSQTSAASPAPSDAWDLPAASTASDTGSGLLDAEGRPRLAGSAGRPGGGLPPGTLVEDYANIDRMGSWRKRADTGVDYQPSQLEQLWVPHENILEEWVRRSIKNILIPIPGTNKVIRCTVVLLMLGGGCGITDPNLLDIEATSRPPPDIPFKPELHEDQDSLGMPPDPASPAQEPPEIP